MFSGPTSQKSRSCPALDWIKQFQGNSELILKFTKKVEFGGVWHVKVNGPDCI